MLLIQKRILLDLQYCYGNVTDIMKDSMHKLSQILNEPIKHSLSLFMNINVEVCSLKLHT